ncbi:hypothetical protein J6590_080330 [Homalodisca vitripennis]|nr:hypothetical protein J6590_080330 [Homalodisca vitripennis]
MLQKIATTDFPRSLNRIAGQDTDKSRRVVPNIMPPRLISIPVEIRDPHSDEVSSWVESARIKLLEELASDRRGPARGPARHLHRTGDISQISPYTLISGE